MSKYRVYETVTVTIVSRPIEGEVPLDAYLQYRAGTNVEQLLRNITGDRNMVAEVEYTGNRLGADVVLLSDDGGQIAPVMHMTDEELKSILGM